MSPFLLRQFSFLLEYTVLYTDLADVVQKGAPLEHLKVRLGNPQTLAEHGSVITDAERMSGRIFILLVDRINERTNHGNG